MKPVSALINPLLYFVWLDTNSLGKTILSTFCIVLFNSVQSFAAFYFS